MKFSSYKYNKITKFIDNFFQNIINFDKSKDVYLEFEQIKNSDYEQIKIYFKGECEQNFYNIYFVTQLEDITFKQYQNEYNIIYFDKNRFEIKDLLIVLMYIYQDYLLINFKN